MNARPIVSMADPATWPLRTILPLVKADVSPWSEDGFGFLVAGRGPVVFRGNVLDVRPGPLAPQLRRFKSTEYECVEAVAQAGWKVD